ncbi:hypothetical protein GALL_534300 [mine drainage metagenome]|uniref:Uncharacterized protein n=1 Tax=mine drainage metagenome TaxID=410659 RepID=A0A1J5P2Y0_9ZZZZ
MQAVGQHLVRLFVLQYFCLLKLLRYGLLIIHIQHRYGAAFCTCEVIGQQDSKRTFPCASFLVADYNDHKN